MNRRYESPASVDDGFVRDLAYVLFIVFAFIGAGAYWASERRSCEHRGGKLVVTGHYQTVCLGKEFVR